MRQVILTAVLMSLAAVAQAYSINHSYSGANKTVEYYGACNDGQMLKVTKHADKIGGALADGEADDEVFTPVDAALNRDA